MLHYKYRIGTDGDILKMEKIFRVVNGVNFADCEKEFNALILDNLDFNCRLIHFATTLRGRFMAIFLLESITPDTKHFQIGEYKILFGHSSVSGVDAQQFEQKLNDIAQDWTYERASPNNPVIIFSKKVADIPNFKELHNPTSESDNKGEENTERSTDESDEEYDDYYDDDFDGSSRSSNDDRSDSMNPNNDSYDASQDNRSNQMNPNNPSYRK